MLNARRNAPPVQPGGQSSKLLRHSRPSLGSVPVFGGECGGADHPQDPLMEHSSAGTARTDDGDGAQGPRAAS